MDDSWLKLVWTFLVATLGVVVGQVIVKLAIDPAAQLHRLIADIGATVLSRQRKIINESEDDDTAEKLRILAGQLRSYSHLIPMLWLWRLPARDHLREAAGLLNLLAYRVGPKIPDKGPKYESTLDTLIKLRKLLRIPTQYSDPVEFDTRKEGSR